MSKNYLAVAEIEQFEPVTGTQTHLLIDSWFHNKRVRRAAHQRGWHVSGGLKGNRTMRLIAEDGSRTWLTLSEYAAQLKPEDWQEAVWPSQDTERTGLCPPRCHLDPQTGTHFVAHHLP